MYDIYISIEKYVKNNPELEDLAKQFLKEAENKLKQSIKDAKKFNDKSTF